MRKGFTLIELLAVIVILAIIAVITVLKIADMISSSRMGGAEDSFYGTLKAAELGYTKALQSKTDLKGDTCDLSKASGDKVTCTNGTVISFTGKVPEKGNLIISAGGTVSAKDITLNGYKCYGDLNSKSPCVKENVEVAHEFLLKSIVTTGDGLYLDSTEKNRYVYKGSSPNNIIKFNNANWRILSVETDGTLKIILEDKLNHIAWNIDSSNEWSNSAAEKALLNYYQALPAEYKDNTTAHIYNIGKLQADKNFGLEKEVDIEKSRETLGNIGLITPSDYVKASNNLTCTSASNSMIASYPCRDQNYLYKPDYSWMTMIASNVEEYIWYIGVSGVYNNAKASSVFWLRPVVYLKANTQLTGSGTSSNPYIIN